MTASHAPDSAVCLLTGPGIFSAPVRSGLVRQMEEVMSADARRDSHRPLKQASTWKKYGFAWVTGLFFVVSLVGHWGLAWGAYVSEQELHGQDPSVSDYLLEVGRDTFENWQSEFLQLIW